jgi:hypothetical protein
MEYQDKPAFSSDEEGGKQNAKRRPAKAQAKAVAQDKAQPTKYAKKVLCHPWLQFP